MLPCLANQSSATFLRSSGRVRGAQHASPGGGPPKESHLPLGRPGSGGGAPWLAMAGHFSLPLSSPSTTAPQSVHLYMRKCGAKRPLYSGARSLGRVRYWWSAHHVCCRNTGTHTTRPMTQGETGRVQVPALRRGVVCTPPRGSRHRAQAGPSQPTHSETMAGPVWP